MQQLMRNKGKKFEWIEKAQVAYENINQELCEAKVLGLPTKKGINVLDTDASVVAISGILTTSGAGMEWENSSTFHCTWQ